MKVLIVGAIAIGQRVSVDFCLTRSAETMSLPQLTRDMPLEFTTRADVKNTKKVAGEELPPENFAYVGDTKKKSTWKLPIKFSSEAKTKRHIRNALARFSSTDMPNAEEKAKAWTRIVAAAKAHGIDVADEKDGQKSSLVELQRQQQVRAERKAKGSAANDDSDDPGDSDQDDEDEEDEEDERDISLSSEMPVPRWFGNEILDHSADCVDMSRCTRGLSFLVDHNTSDQVGLLANVRVDGKKLKGTPKFSRSQRGQDIKRDIDDGIRPFTSIGYRVMEMQLEKEEDAGNGNKLRTYRVTKWMPMEGSSVSVPADHTVGPGRAAGKEEFPVQVRSAASEKSPQSQNEVKRTMNPKDAAEILRLCTLHKIDNKRAAEMIEKEGMTVDVASREILAEVAKRNGGALPTPAAENSGKMLTLTERESKQYNICRGIMTLVGNTEESKRETSFETEISDELEKRHEGKKHGGLFVPYNLGIDPGAVGRATEFLKRAGVATALTVGTTGQGKELVFTEPGPFIQFLYNQMRLKELGAETISGLVGNVAFPKQTGKATGSWVGENPGTDVADSNLTLSQVTTSPKTYQSSTSYSRQLLAQAVIDIDNLVRKDLATVCALAMDLAGINGTGSGNNQPLGILGTTGVQSYTVEGDTGNGAKPDWNDITKMEELLEDVNADQLGEPAWLTTPGIKGLFKRTPRLVYAPAGTGTTVNVTGDPIWADDNEIDGLMARWSNQVPNTLTTGTSGTCHALILGVFSALINGLWGSGFELVVDPYRLKKQGLIELTTFILTDWANRYPVAFAVAADCLKQ